MEIMYIKKKQEEQHRKRWGIGKRVQFQAVRKERTGLPGQKIFGVGSWDSPSKRLLIGTAVLR